ncbi:MAG TPA: PspC domain-containing protein [Streptosporangiaceae bacterium]|nr:PspC domain-containing protein [Streptosporangiaceae bacterium]
MQDRVPGNSEPQPGVQQPGGPQPGGPPPPGWQHPGGEWHSRGLPLRRATEGRLAGGVAAGIAARTGFNLTVIRIVIVIASLLSGFGLAAYVVAWLFLPTVDESPTIASRAFADAKGLALAAVTASMIIVALVIISIFGIGVLSSFSWPVVIGAAGMVLVWRNADAAEQETMRTLAQPLLAAGGVSGNSRWRLRIVVACVMLIAGLVTVGTVKHAAQLLAPLGGVVLIIGAILVLLGPWWIRVLRALLLERQGRVRAEERADIASRVHDSVLQTLALIQRRADNPQQVIQLARAQERELRSWLFDGRAPGSMEGLATTFAGGIRLIQQDVEAQHEIAVEAVTVGDCEIDDDLSALLAAAREATVNAAKWSGANVVSLFAEVEPTEVSVFIRDRGRGFDPESVPDDRKGLAESVKARMTRRGGSATVKSVLGEGTEVGLTMRRTAGQRETSQTT